MAKKQWYRLEDVEKMPAKEKVSLTQCYVNPGMVRLFNLLGFEKIWGAAAEGMYIILGDGRRILDMTGGSCVLGLGHNHPRVLAARNSVSAGKRLEICKAFLSPYVAALAANMANLLPEDLEYSFFCNSGAEAIEGALKLAEKHHGPNRTGIVYTDHSFHGKTHAAMSISSLDDSRENFKLLGGCHRVPYGDADALEKFFSSRHIEGSNKTDLCAFIVEAIHGTRIIFPPPGYLRKVRDICTNYDVLLILDEIYTGFGRTGYYFAFEAEEIIPDIVCYSKTFGGGKATIAGYTARRPVFLRAYGSTQDAMLHSSTFSGMTEECATAIEVLNIFKEERLVERSRELGHYLGERLNYLKIRYPNRIRDVRGRGLLWGIELIPLLEKFDIVLRGIFGKEESALSALTGAMVLSELFHRHNILAYLGFTKRNLIVFSPALIVDKQELDKAVSALEDILADDWVKLGRSFVARQF